MSELHDELWQHSRRLAAERARPKPAPPDNDPLRTLIATLAGLLANPGPPDPPAPAVHRTDTTQDRNQDRDEESRNG